MENLIINNSDSVLYINNLEFENMILRGDSCKFPEDMDINIHSDFGSIIITKRGFRSFGKLKIEEFSDRFDAKYNTYDITNIK